MFFAKSFALARYSSLWMMMRAVSLGGGVPCEGTTTLSTASLVWHYLLDLLEGLGVRETTALLISMSAGKGGKKESISPPALLRALSLSPSPTSDLFLSILPLPGPFLLTSPLSLPSSIPLGLRYHPLPYPFLNPSQFPFSSLLSVSIRVSSFLLNLLSNIATFLLPFFTSIFHSLFLALKLSNFLIFSLTFFHSFSNFFFLLLIS